MDLLQIIVLAVLQGLTEFLPISSSAHLILLPRLAGWNDQGLAFDVAVHVGTLSAVLWYFRRDLTPMARDWARSWKTRRLTAEGRLAWAVLFGTMPVGLVGLALNGIAETTLRSPLMIAAATIGFGLLLGWSDLRGMRQRDEHAINWRDILVVGCAQALALIPGASRSGVAITAGLMMGLTRRAAARFSFLLSIPVIALAGVLKTQDLQRQPDNADWAALALGAVLAAVSAYACIHFFLKLLERVGIWPFVAYRLILGTLLIIWFW